MDDVIDGSAEPFGEGPVSHIPQLRGLEVNHEGTVDDGDFEVTDIGPSAYGEIFRCPLVVALDNKATLVRRPCNNEVPFNQFSLVSSRWKLPITMAGAEYNKPASIIAWGISHNY